MQLAEGVVIKSLKSFKDSRGHLTELFRSDELPEGFLPEMAYISVTHPGISRGPHEHVYQTDLFGFVDGSYELRLWENREGYEPWELKIEVGKDNPTAVIVPPGVVHGYKNIGDKDAFVLNFPNKLYAGKNRAEIVDEIRHENTDSVFTMD
ncbi:MAG: dTDP-4-dehydrorhamnose 3,5-epimerase family protein [Armatimonadetes bacterium]|nr:dTDP-4-dehydrorhamnose 3,5-epimerase family protein [Armatimonadota bacterium]